MRGFNAKTASCTTPSPNLSPKGERSMSSHAIALPPTGERGWVRRHARNSPSERPEKKRQSQIAVSYAVALPPDASMIDPVT